MKEALLLSFKRAETITVKDLETKLRDRKSSAQTLRNEQKGGKGTSNLTIISPFYERLNHKPNCTCKYHKRAERVIVKQSKMKTEPNQGHFSNQANKKLNKVELGLADVTGMENLFEVWKNKLSSDEIKKMYSEYLNNLGNCDKIRRLDKLDCHNEAFEEFLRNNYLVILEKKTKKDEKAKEKQNYAKEKQLERQKEGIKSKSSQRLAHKIFTEGNIDLEALSEFNFRRQVSNRDGSFRRSEFDSSKDEVLSKDTIKLKKIGIKGTGKTLQLIDQEQIRSRKEDPRRKKAKFMNSRPSFFGLIQDQQLLRELCLKLMNENKRANREAEHIVRQLVESDIDAYQKMIEDIEADLQSGIKLRNLNDEEANLLIKIVLNKIHRQAKASDSRDQHYSHKNSLIEELCNKYGWPKQDKVIQLTDFWKMRHQRGHNSNIYSGKSFGHGRESKSTLSRNNLSEVKQSKKSRSKVKIKEEKRASGFYNQKSDLRLSKINQSSTKTFIHHDKSIDEVIESNPQSDFKINEKKAGIKQGFFGKSRKQKKRSSNFFIENENKMYNSKKNYGIFNRSKFTGKTALQTLQQSQDGIVDGDEVSQIPLNKGRLGEQSNQQRTSSFFLHVDNLVQRHIEVNKRFLKRIEHDLIDNQCEKLIIGMGESIITKKRKIRAMHHALETEELKNSDYYHDILRYLEVYEDYCDLVLKSKKERVVRQKSNANIACCVSQDEQKEEEETSLCMLLDDLRKERQLKFINLNLLKEKENPKEELILQIPQYTTNISCKSKKKRQTKLESFGHSQSESDQAVAEKRESAVFQKQLQDKVSLFIHKNAEKRQQNNVVSEREQIDDIFRKKMEHYRKIFKLSPQIK